MYIIFNLEILYNIILSRFECIVFIIQLNGLYIQHNNPLSITSLISDHWGCQAHSPVEFISNSA